MRKTLRVCTVFLMMLSTFAVVDRLALADPRVCDDTMCWPPEITPPSPHLNALSRVEIQIENSGANIRTAPCFVSATGGYNNCASFISDFFLAPPDKCNSSAVYSDGTPTLNGDCEFIKAESVPAEPGGLKAQLFNPPPPPPYHGCLQFDYTLYADGSTLSFRDAADNVWAIGSANPSDVIGTFEGTAFDPVTNSWQSKLVLKGTAIDAFGATKNIEITLTGRVTSSNTCFAYIPVSSFAGNLSGTGVVQ